MGYIEANGTKIHYEQRGHGRAVLLISGATGDAGHWTSVAETLADGYTVVSYDRRGNSRSPRPPDWAATTIEEQADDAAALLRGFLAEVGHVGAGSFDDPTDGRQPAPALIRSRRPVGSGLSWSGLRGAWMASTSEPLHLNNHHRNTLRQIFQHPAGHNIEWHAVVSLLEAVGSVVEHRDGKVAVTLGSETEFFDPPPHKDIDTQTVVNLRRMLSNAGYGIEVKEVEGEDQED